MIISILYLITLSLIGAESLKCACNSTCSGLYTYVTGLNPHGCRTYFYGSSSQHSDGQLDNGIGNTQTESKNDININSTRKCSLGSKSCEKSKYRSMDGSCNNLCNPKWGMAHTPYGRLTPYNYADGISALARSDTGNPLPNARELSFTFFPQNFRPDPNYSLGTQQWGQIVAHDMSFGGDVPQNSSDPIICCDNNGQLASDADTNPVCAPILIPPNDPIHAWQGTQCINFQRDLSIRDKGSPNSPAQQITSVTGFMDLSIVYGNSDSEAAKIRTGTGGRLATTYREGREWPPQAPNVTSTCAPVESPKEPCYLVGDSRVNQNPQLTIIQIVLLREHNRNADALAHLNPHWNDETIYQEARRILIAKIQHINYYEYLPILLGHEIMIKNKLIYKKIRGYVRDYNPCVDPSVFSEHATAAWRHFHTLIRGYLELMSESRYLKGIVRLSDWFNRPLLLEMSDNFESLSRGLTTQKMDFSDQYWDDEITQFLFRNNKTFGDDLRAIDIQRGRDHGLSSYIVAREVCGLPVPKSYQDLLIDISPKNVAKLHKMYGSLENIDLVVAGSLERMVPGALVGPTFLCILIEQFYRTRVGDRFFYENGMDDIAFTPSQLQEIRKSSIARLLCDNVDGINIMQRQAFLLISLTNPLVPCEDLPFINLTFWRDTISHK